MLNLTDSDFQRLYTYIKKHYGIDLSKKKQLIVSRLSNTLASQGFKDFSAYVDEILSGRDPEMVTAMLNKLTTNYTYFLREEDHFKYLWEKACPRQGSVHMERRLFVRRRTLHHLHVFKGVFRCPGFPVGYQASGHGYITEDSEHGHLSLLQ